MPTLSYTYRGVVQVWRLERRACILYVCADRYEYPHATKSEVMIGVWLLFRKIFLEIEQQVFNVSNTWMHSYIRTYRNTYTQTYVPAHTITHTHKHIYIKCNARMELKMHVIFVSLPRVCTTNSQVPLIFISDICRRTNICTCKYDHTYTHSYLPTNKHMQCTHGIKNARVLSLIATCVRHKQPNSID